MKKENASAVIIWFRKDLRLYDNPAFAQGAGASIIPLFIWDEDNPYNPGRASQWWLNKSLIALQQSLKAYGLSLILRRGNPLKILQELVAAHDVVALYWNRCYDPYSIERDKKIKEAFKNRISCQSFNASLLAEPWTLKTQAGKPYQVFTLYWQTLKTIGSFSHPLPTPLNVKGYKDNISSDSLETWKLHPIHPDWSQGLEEEWTPGEEGAQTRLAFFLEHHIQTYQQNRNEPNLEATSKLSPHLHWGEISPRQVWHSTLTHTLGISCATPWSFLREIAWREFSYYSLYHFPILPHEPLRELFKQFPWAQNEASLDEWQKGMTGYPIVDAGMRQLWHTGWMHNRVRMIAASFLVKHLLLPWQKGAAWFWDTLVDADIANNSANWQWIAGCGRDAAPYFRIFNPTLQGQKFDPQGKYVRRWIPELHLLPDKYIHIPWEAPTTVLELAGIKLGEIYPLPLIDHKKARIQALEAFKAIHEK